MPEFKHLNVPPNIGMGEGGGKLPKIEGILLQIDGLIDQLLTSGGTEGPAGADGVGVQNITSDGTNITFHMTDGTTHDIPWPTQT